MLRLDAEVRGIVNAGCLMPAKRVALQELTGRNPAKMLKMLIKTFLLYFLLLAPACGL